MNFIKRIPYGILIPIAVLLGMAPFVPEPHLWQKLKMLFSGELGKPVDIFDLFLHGTPVTLLLLKLSLATSKED